LSLKGARGDEEAFRPLEVPASYRSAWPEDVVPGNVARIYARMDRDLRDGLGVPTPVWFARDVLRNAPTIAVFYIYSEADAGKVKRIRNNPKVRVAPCTMRGDVRGAWIDGRARICEDDEAAHGQQLLTQKYGLLKILGDFFSRLMRHKQTVIAVEVD